MIVLFAEARGFLFIYYVSPAGLLCPLSHPIPFLSIDLICITFASPHHLLVTCLYTLPNSLDGPCRWRCNQGGPSQHLGQPLPRKVRFKIDRGQQQYRRQDGVEERRATTTVATAVQGNALLALGTMNSAQQRALLGVQQAQKKQQER